MGKITRGYVGEIRFMQIKEARDKKVLQVLYTGLETNIDNLNGNMVFT